MPPGFMNATARYIDISISNWFTLHISVANLLVILLMIVVFTLAVLLPFPGGREAER